MAVSAVGPKAQVQAPILRGQRDVIVHHVMPLLQEVERVRLGRCSRDLRLWDRVSVPPGGRALHVTALAILANPAPQEMERLAHLLTTEPAGREVRMVKFVLSKNQALSHESVQYLLQNLDWSRLQHLDCRNHWVSSLTLFDFLSQKLREAVCLRRCYFSTLDDALVQLISELPQTVENLSAYVTGEQHIEAVRERLARPITELSVTAFYGLDPALNQGILDLLPISAPQLEILNLSWEMTEPQIVQLISILGGCKRLKSLHIQRVEAIRPSLFEALLPLARDGYLKRVCIDCIEADLSKEEEVLLARALLRFPPMELILQTQSGDLTLTEIADELYRKRSVIFREVDSPLKEAKLEVLDSIAKSRIIEDYRREWLFFVPIEPLAATTERPSMLIQELERLIGRLP
jgi:hypothetical protein